jgi:MoxR-like ATPase
MRRVSNFETFIKGRQQVNSNHVNEGVFSWIKDNVINKLTGWAKSFYDKLTNGDIPKVPAGEPYAGKPSVMLYLPENGPIDKQIEEVHGSQGMTEAVVPLEYSEPDQSVRDISTEEFKNMIRRLYRSKISGGRAKPIFVYGAPGIGKTQIVGAVATELGIPLMDFKNLDVQFMNPEDFSGVPSQHNIEDPTFKEVETTDADGNVIRKRVMTSQGKGFTRFNAPANLPTDNGSEGKGGFIFLDEMNRADKTVLNKLMQFVQMGRLPDYQLPDKWVIIAAGNRPSEADVAEFDFALANRFTIVNYVPTVEEWGSWAASTEKILPELVSFLSDNKQLFHKLDTDKESKTFPTPRSWTDGALILFDEIKFIGGQSWRDVPSREILNIFRDQVGAEAAGAFNGYLDVLRNISEKDLETMMNNPSAAIKIPGAERNKSILRGVSEMVLKKVKTYDAQTLYNIMEYFSQYGQAEMLSWLLKSMFKRFPEAQAAITDPSNPDQPIAKKMAEIATSSAASKIK